MRNFHYRPEFIAIREKAFVNRFSAKWGAETRNNAPRWLLSQPALITSLRYRNVLVGNGFSVALLLV